MAQSKSKPAQKKDTSQVKAPPPEPVKPVQKLQAPAKVGTDWWNLLYYASVLMGLTVGLVTFVNGGSPLMALTRFLVTLLGVALLGSGFLGFVVMPVQIKRHNERVQAERIAFMEAQAARAREAAPPPPPPPLPAMDRPATPADLAQVDGLMDELAAEIGDDALKTIMELRRHLAEPNAKPNGAAANGVPNGQAQPAGVDQASGLRQMVAASSSD
jgi:hypothetical protein